MIFRAIRWEMKTLGILFPWCRGADSNRRHQDFQSCALPTELPRRIKVEKCCRVAVLLFFYSRSTSHRSTVALTGGDDGI